MVAVATKVIATSQLHYPIMEYKETETSIHSFHTCTSKVNGGV
jgi:hypothetical protein